MKHTLSVIVENKPGVLARISGLFSRRGFNIDSLAVGRTESPDISRMTIVIDAEEISLEQVTKQLHKLINVLKIQDLDPKKSVDRELVLIKVNVTNTTRPQVVQIVDIFRGSVVDVGTDTLTIEVTGTESKIEALIELVRPFGIKELVRTGVVSLARGIKSSEEE